MLQTRRQCYQTFYDNNNKIWSGAQERRYYNRECSMGRILFEEMRRKPKAICQISDSEHTKLTNEEALCQAICIAKYFENFGLTQKDIIGIACRNTTYLMAITLACLFRGIAFHAINPRHDEKTARHHFHVTKPKIIFCDGQDYAKIKAATDDLSLKIITLKERVEGVAMVVDLLEPVEGEQEFEPLELDNGPDQTTAILCSSGSTGFPKLITISNTSRLYEWWCFLTMEDVTFCGSTLDWLSGLTNLFASIIYGALRIISDQPLTAEYFLELIDKYKITTTIVGSPFLAMLVKSPSIALEKLSSLRYFDFGGAKCLTPTLAKMQSYLPNATMTFGYGLTEVGAIITSNANIALKPNSVGRILPGYKIKIIDENGDNLGPGAVGELCCYHGNWWQGYVDNPVATAEMYDIEQWFHTGDLGYMDEDMYLYVVDRKKDLLKYEFMHYSPNEIEQVIAELPAVVEVCVFGVWNELKGDAAAAVVVILEQSALSAQDIVDYVAHSIEASYKQLHAGALILHELPRTVNGKVDRKATKDIYLKLRGSTMQ